MDDRAESLFAENAGTDECGKEQSKRNDGFFDRSEPEQRENLRDCPPEKDVSEQFMMSAEFLIREFGNIVVA